LRVISIRRLNFKQLIGQMDFNGKQGNFLARVEGHDFAYGLRARRFNE
jgi:hypothetical protein